MPFIKSFRSTLNLALNILWASSLLKYSKAIGRGYDYGSLFFKGFCSVKVVCVIVGYNQILYGFFGLCLYSLYELFSQFVSAEGIKDYNSIPCDDKVSVGYKASVFLGLPVHKHQKPRKCPG